MERITFQNSDGLNLVGALHVPAQQKSAAVIICPGFTSNKDRPRHVQMAEALAKNGIAAFRIDFGGCGESEDREITVKGEIDDLRSAIRFMSQKGYMDIGLLGESLGGLVALEVYDDGIKATVLWAPVTSNLRTTEITDEQQAALNEKGYYVREKDGRKHKIPGIYLEERAKVDRKQLLSRIKIPVLIVHGTADTTIPIQKSEEAIKLLPEGSRLEIIENWQHGDHKMDESMDVIIPKTVEWFKSHLKIWT
ncbi:MAG TPA: alpha/beta hydrolase [Candidatus Paceibacterota bacterium]